MKEFSCLKWSWIYLPEGNKRFLYTNLNPDDITSTERRKLWQWGTLSSGSWALVESDVSLDFQGPASWFMDRELCSHVGLPKQMSPSQTPCFSRNPATYLFCMTDLASTFQQVLSIVRMTEPAYQVNLMGFFILANCKLLSALSLLCFLNVGYNWKTTQKPSVQIDLNHSLVLDHMGTGVTKAKSHRCRVPTLPDQTVLNRYALFSLQID